jgi:hypothetical protein
VHFGFAACLQDAELAGWRAVVGAAGGDAGASGMLPYSRLAGDEEVAPLVLQAEELLKPKQAEDAGGPD